MAYLPFQNTNPEEQNLNPVVSGSQQSSIVNVPSNGAGSSSMPKERKTSSGNFTNLQQYLDANKEQASSIGTQLTAGAEKKASDFTSTLDSLKSSFSNQVNAQNKAVDSNFINQAVSNPTLFVQNTDNLNRFTQARQGGYTGPKSLMDLSEYQTAQSKLNDASSTLQNISTEQGRTALLLDTFNRPSYTRGQQKLDQLLVQNSPDVKNQLLELSNRYSNINGLFDTAKSEADAQLKAILEANEASRNQIQSVLGREDDPTTPQDERLGAFGQFQSDLENRTKSYKDTQQALVNRANQQLQNGTFDEDILSLLGLKANQSLYDVNLLDYAPQFNADNISAQRVATADDYAKYNALAQLAGINPTLLSDSSLAGTAAAPAVNKEQLQSTLQSRASLLADRQRDLINAQAAYNQASLDLGEGEIRDINLNFTPLGARFRALEQALAQANSNYAALNPNRVATVIPGKG